MSRRHWLTWLGLALFVLGCALGLLPLLPATPARGAMRDVPHWPWTSAGIGVTGLLLLLWQRGRGDDRGR